MNNPVSQLNKFAAMTWFITSVSGAAFAAFSSTPAVTQLGKILLVLSAGYMLFGLGLKSRQYMFLEYDLPLKALAAELYKEMSKNMECIIEALQKKDQVKIEELSNKEKHSLMLDFLRKTRDDQFHKVSELTSGMSPVEACRTKMALTEMIWQKYCEEKY